MTRTGLWPTALALFALNGGAAYAADHRDGPSVLTDPSTDITDVYTWMSSDGAKAYLVLDLQGANTGATATTKFSDKALYVLHLTSQAAYGATNPAADTIVCRFDTASVQNLECWGPGNEYVKGASGNVSGIASASGRMRVFAGPRNDPFYFNIRGFLAATSAVKTAAPTLMPFDKAGCPGKIDVATSGVVVGVLASNGAGGAAADDFGAGGKSGAPGATVATNGNVLSIVIAIDKALVTTGGPVVGVWASTNKSN